MPHILFLMSDTGGGHRAAARAIEAALHERDPSRFTVELVDLWKDYTSFPFNTIPDTASHWIDALPSSYSATFWLWDLFSRSHWWTRLYCRLLLSRMKRLHAEHPADVIVCVHAAFVRPAVHALRKTGSDKPFITVITDYAWPTCLWYDPRVDRCLVPTEPAYERGLALGMKPAQMFVTGPPVHPKFSKLGLSKLEARAQLGWSLDRRVILIIGGGDGTGPVLATARAIDERELGCELVVIAGRNQSLKTALESAHWKGAIRVYGFVENMHVMMRASDLLITKAGPATITEAAILGLPLVLNGGLKYQESPNIDYVVERGAGVYAPGAKKTADQVEKLLDHGGAGLEKLAAGLTRIAQPDAVWKIADEIRRYV